MRIKGWQRNRKYWEQVILSRQSFGLISASICSLSAWDGQAAGAFKKTTLKRLLVTSPSSCHRLWAWVRHHGEDNPGAPPAVEPGAGIHSRPRKHEHPPADHSSMLPEEKSRWFIALCFTAVVSETGL